MEPLPTVEEIYRDEIGLDESITAELKALVKSFRRAYEKDDDVDYTSESMKLSSSKEIKEMAVKFLEKGIAADPRTKQNEVPAANHLWVRARGPSLEYRKDRTKILASLSRLFARQNRYRDRNVNARGERRPNEAGDVLHSVNDPNLPDVDEMLQASGRTRPKNKEGEVPQTRSGRTYNYDLPVTDTSTSGVNNGPTPLAVPVATMTQGLNWGCFASSGIDSKPPKDLTSEKVTPGTSAKHTSPNKNRYAYVTSDNEDSDNVNSFNEDSALAEALAATTDVTQNEVESIIDDAVRQMDTVQPGSERQDKSASPGQPPSEDRILKLKLSNKRKRPESVDSSHEIIGDEIVSSTGARTSVDDDYTVGEKAVKRPKTVNRITDAYKARKSRNDRTQINNKPTGPRQKDFTPAQNLNSTVPSVPSGIAPSEAGISNSAADVRTPLSGRRLVKRPAGICTNPRLASRMLQSRRKPARRSPHHTHQAIRAHTLPPSLGGEILEKPKAHERSNVAHGKSAISTMDMQGPQPEVAQTTGTEAPLRERGDRELSQTLEPEPPVGRAVPEQSLTQSHEAAPSPRRPRIAVRFAQTVSTIFQAVDQVSQFRHIDTAHVRFQTDEQEWTYTIAKDDPDQFEDMKRSITADIRATTRRNRNNNNDFKIYIEPVGGANAIADETMEEADDEIIPGL